MCKWTAPIWGSPLAFYSTPAGPQGAVIGGMPRHMIEHDPAILSGAIPRPAYPPAIPGTSHSHGRVRSQYHGHPFREERFGGRLEQTMQSVRSKTQGNR
jgi:hypothetical protein